MRALKAAGVMPGEVVWRSVSADDTEAAGARVGAAAGPRDIIALWGPLGAGKTTFVRGLHAGAAARGRPRSPSFTTLNVYAGSVPIHHFDLYRYEAAGPAFLDEFGEWLEADAIVVIEWPERLGDWLPQPRLDIRFTDDGDSRRTLALSSSSGGEWAERLASAEWTR